MARLAARAVLRIPARCGVTQDLVSAVAFRTTDYFKFRRLQPDRRRIEDAWIEEAIRHPIRERVG
jgi:hypothetical protein